MFHLGYILFTTKGRQSQLYVHLILKVFAYHVQCGEKSYVPLSFSYPFFSFPMHSKVFDPIVVHFAVKRCR